MNAGIESTFANHSLIKQLLEPFRLLSRHTPDSVTPDIFSSFDQQKGKSAILAGVIHLGGDG